MKFIDKVREDPSILKDFSTPPFDVQVAAIKTDPTSIRYIRNPNEKIQALAVSLKMSAYNFIINPSRAAKIELIKNDPYSIEDLGFDDEDLVTLAVSLKPKVILTVPNSNHNLQSLAYFKDNSVIFSLKSPSELLLKLHLENYPKTISNFKNLPWKIQFNHIKNCKSVADLHRRFSEIKNPHVPVQEFYVQSLMGMKISPDMITYYITGVNISNRIDNDLKIKLFNCINFSEITPRAINDLRNIFIGVPELEIALTIIS